MKMLKYCPFCGATNSLIVAEDFYYCNTCNTDFSSEDVKHEILRQKISAVCSFFKATEENPLNCVLDDEMELHISGVDEVAQGLSEFLKPQVENLFQDPEGVVWVTIDGEVIELDNILTDSMSEILEWLKDVYNIEPLNDLDNDRTQQQNSVGFLGQGMAIGMQRKATNK